jgi:hypothetical protein
LVLPDDSLISRTQNLLDQSFDKLQESKSLKACFEVAKDILEETVQDELKSILQICKNDLWREYFEEQMEGIDGWLSQKH